MKRRILFLLVWVLAGLVCGFISEMVKVNLNFRIDLAQHIAGYDTLLPAEKNLALEHSEMSKNAPFDYYYSHSRINALSHFSMRELNMLKWGNTFFFIAVFLCINFRLLKILITDSPVRKILFPAYAILFLISICIYGIGFMAGHPDVAYVVARKIAGLLQSMIPAVVLYFGHLLSIRSAHG